MAGRPPTDPNPGRDGIVAAIIPARFASSRLPGKPLLAETGRPLIQHVVEAAAPGLADRPGDRRHRRRPDPRRRPGRFGGEAVADPVRPPERHRPRRRGRRTGSPGPGSSSTSRATSPRSSPRPSTASSPCSTPTPAAPMATLCTPIVDRETYLDPSCVKVVTSPTGRALYFSRRPIPCHRDGEPDGTAGAARPAAPRPLRLPPRLPAEAGDDAALAAGTGREARAAPGPGGRRADRRWASSPTAAVGIDTPEDYRRFVDRWRAGLVRAA